ncbi:MAG TPA: hypothetical protein VMM92_07835, partial [Thermoanaerobaculia bacterium]|nr:hypothetical protein [Thermoanaerobaculia bacterium]
APGLWERLKPYAFKAQQAIVRESREFHIWSLVEFLALLSVRVAAESAEKALELAQLAVTAAEAIGGRTPWAMKLRAFAYAHLGNAYRVLMDLRKAEEAFATFSELWKASKDVPAVLLDEARLVAMKAALRREQRRFDDALELLRQAEVLDKSGDLRGVLLVSKAKTLEEANRPEEAIAVLREAERWIDPKGDPRLTLCLRHNLLLLLIDLGSFVEADALLPEVAALARRLGNNRLDLIRLTWGEARIAAGVGDRERAITLFTQVRGEFMSRGMIFDAALVALDLAAFYAGEGRHGEVRVMARSLVPIFEVQGVDREALASLAALRQAAEREAATISLIHTAAAALKRARPKVEGGVSDEKKLWAEIAEAESHAV